MEARSPDGAAAEAARCAADWASKAGVEIEVVRTERSAREVGSVLAGVWPRQDGQAPLNADLAWALAHSGNYVALARSRGEPVGAAFGFRAMDADGAHLHSHMAGVLPDHRGANVGFALKQHQRAWAVAEDLPRVTWTFDPLVARNAYFNVTKLGARVTAYYVNFYGELDDGINAGDDSDRCLVTWSLAEPRVLAAADGALGECDLSALRASGAVAVLARTPEGEPLLTGERCGTVRLAQLPDDVVGLRHSDLAAAKAWRTAVRAVLKAAFDDGLEVTAVSRDGWYVMA